jgi:hypothetical protein
MQWFLNSSNPISFFAVNIAILALFASVIILYIEKTIKSNIKDIKIKQKDIDDQWFFLHGISEQTVGCFTKLDGLISTQHVVLRHILQNFKDIDHVYLVNYNNIHRNLNKNIQHLIIYSNNIELKQSALKQLSEDVGDAETFRRLLELIGHERQLISDLQNAIKALERRINEKLNCPRTDLT